MFLVDHNGSGFDSYNVSIKLLQWRTVVNIFKNGAGIVSPKKYNGFVDKDKKIPHYVPFRYGRVHIDKSLKKKGIKYKLKPLLLKQELDHDEIYGETWEDKENEWLPYLKNDVLSTVFSYARYVKGMEEVTKFGVKSGLTLPSLAKNTF